MNRRVIVWPRAEQHLREHFNNILLDKVEPAVRLLEVARKSFTRLGETPSLGRRFASSYTRLKNIRLYPMPAGFRDYIIFYQVTSEVVDILAIVHGARNLEAVVREMDI